MKKGETVTTDTGFAPGGIICFYETLVQVLILAC